MIYIGRGRFLDVDNILEMEENPALVYGDKIINGKTVYSLIKKIPGVLTTNGAIFGIVKKGKVIRLVSTESRYPNFKVVTSKTGKKSNEYCVIRKGEYKNQEHYGEIMNIMDGIGNFQTEEIYLKNLFNVGYKKLKIDMSKFKDCVEEHRKSLINDNIKPYSIDPPNCYDIDDAIHIIKNNNITEVGVHIADVSSIIQVGSDLDKIILERGESVYLKNQQIDMLPKEMVEELSLFEQKEKKAFTVIMKFKNLDLIEVDFKRTLIKVEKNLSYDKASNLDISDIKLLYEFGKLLYSKQNKDNLDYNIHKTVEIFMVLANQQVAKKIKDAKIYNPIFRKYKYIDSLGNAVQDPKIKEIIKYFNSDKAFYSLNGTHDDLGEYSHFTSPIRRYIDIITHRMLWGSIIKNNKQVTYLDLEELIENINFRNMEIKKASRESHRLHESYIRSKTKNIETKTGKIVRFGNNSITVYFDDENFTVLCKLVPEKLNKDDYIINIDNHILKIKIYNHEETFKLGQTVKVNVLASFNSPKLSDKLTGQLIEPDLRNFYL